MTYRGRAACRAVASSVPSPPSATNNSASSCICSAVSGETVQASTRRPLRRRAAAGCRASPARCTGGRAMAWRGLVAGDHEGHRPRFCPSRLFHRGAVCKGFVTGLPRSWRCGRRRKPGQNWPWRRRDWDRGGARPGRPGGPSAWSFWRSYTTPRLL